LSETNGVRNWHPHFLEKLYHLLTLDDRVEPVDLVFVMAGRMNRKHYGLELFRQGITQKLVLSVDRFEVSKMWQTELPRLDKLMALRSITPPNQRHFFVTLDRSGVKVERVSLPSSNTYGEVVGLSHYLEHENAGKVMIVSTDIHLQRVACTIRKVILNSCLEFRYCPIPGAAERLTHSWWSHQESRSYVFSELIKLFGYCLILSMPAQAGGRLMRLRC
jgi:hypothetical protein